MPTKKSTKPKKKKPAKKLAVKKTSVATLSGTAGGFAVGGHEIGAKHIGSATAIVGSIAAFWGSATAQTALKNGGNQQQSAGNGQGG